MKKPGLLRPHNYASALILFSLLGRGWEDQLKNQIIVKLMHVSQKRLCILSIEKTGPEPTYLSTSTTSKQSKVQIQLWPSSPTSNTCRLLNQISKVNTKSTNLNGTYRKRSVFQHLLKKHSKNDYLPQHQQSRKNQTYQFFSSGTQKSKSFFFSQRLIFVKIRF